MFADLGEIRHTGRKYRQRSPFCPGRWAENFLEKLFLVPLLLEFWIFNNRLIFLPFYGFSSQNHYSDELRADLISLFPVLISFLVQILSLLYHFLLIEVRGDPHGVFRPREGGLTRIRCFRVVSCRVVLSSLSSSSSSPPRQGS